jgi:hypothetical protein
MVRRAHSGAARRSGDTRAAHNAWQISGAATDTDVRSARGETHAAARGATHLIFFFSASVGLSAIFLKSFGGMLAEKRRGGRKGLRGGGALAARAAPYTNSN